ncbi:MULTISPECIES: hypothetical protein [unclassified Streptomyces]|uniref:hypothetical protein n=1 Tax=unclassified Streptomyces TaxID=2593676 RepID=UPI00324D1C0F
MDEVRRHAVCRGGPALLAVEGQGGGPGFSGTGIFAALGVDVSELGPGVGFSAGVANGLEVGTDAQDTQWCRRARDRGGGRRGDERRGAGEARRRRLAGVPLRAVCVYGQNVSPWADPHPTGVYWSYGAHNLSGQYGNHWFVSNQYGGAGVSLCKGYNGPCVTVSSTPSTPSPST